MTRETTERIPVIHIGMPKTATKTLQWRLFAGHSQIHYLGRFDGPQFRKAHRKLDACRDAQVQALMHEIAYINVERPDFAKCDVLVEEVLRPAREGNLVPVWSWESYATDTLGKRRMRARNLRRVFGEARILMTLRHPVGLLESAYLQQLKRDNVGPGARTLRGPFCCPIDDWLDAEWPRDVKHHLEYAETLRAYVDLFGVANVHVCLFEDLCADSRAFFTGICERMGISSREGLDLVEGERDNSRWTQHQLDVLEKIGRNPLRALHFRIAGRKARREMLGLDQSGAPEVVGPRARVRMSGPWRERVMAVTRAGNEWLIRTFNLPLEKYGYLDR